MKYNFNGDVEWITDFNNSPSAPESFNGITVASDGIYAAGTINNTVEHRFGSTEATWVTGVVSGNNTVIVKYNFSGIAVWAKTVAKSGSNSIYNSSFNAISAGSDGVYAAGHIYGAASTPPYYYDFGNSKTVEAVYAGMNLVIVKYDFNGNALWAKSVSGTNIYDSQYKSIVVLNDNVYAAGVAYSNITYNLGDSVTVTGGNSANFSALLVKYSSDGKALWAKTVISTSAMSSYWSVYAADEDIYTSGQIYYTDTFNFGNSVTLSGGQSGQYYPSLVKYDSDGNAIWARTAKSGVTSSCYFGSIAVGSEGIYAAGPIRNDGTDYFDFGGVSSPVMGGCINDYNALLVKYK